MMTTLSSATALQRQLAEAEAALLDLEDEEPTEEYDEEDEEATEHQQASSNKRKNLQALTARAQTLQLVLSLTTWVKQYREDDETYDSQVTKDLDSLQSLARILQQHDDSYNTLLLEKVYENEFLPLQHYLRQALVVQLRKNLKEFSYPTGCEASLQAWEDGDDTVMERFLTTTRSIQRLTVIAKQVDSHLTKNEAEADMDHHHHHDNTTIDLLTTELMRPLVERVRFHFLDSSSTTTSKIDRLPEWVWDYIETHFFASGAWELIRDVLAEEDSSGMAVLQHSILTEVTCLYQYVLQERNYFRHDSIAGPDSNPTFLANAIGQLFHVDQFLQAQWKKCNKSMNNLRLVSVMDACVTGDEELLQWWLDRERETAFATLEGDLGIADSIQTKSLSSVSPRAELFCALMHSMQTKACLFSFSGPYLAHVASPLCLHFVEAVEASAEDLQDELASNRNMIHDLDGAFKANLRRWVELLNGTQLAVQVLSSSNANLEDLQRFGQSLQALQDVLVRNVCQTIVEVNLMERARLASYCMRCSHVMAVGCDTLSELEASADIAPDLLDAHRLVRFFADFMQSFLSSSNEDDNTEIDWNGLPQFAPLRLLESVTTRLVHKFLNILLNEDGMTPDLVRPGCALFLRDVQALFPSSNSNVSPIVMRLLDIARLASLDRYHLTGIGNALCGLASQPAPLDASLFDTTLADEAVAMVRVKGFLWVELEDVLTVLNRRRDLGLQD